MQMIKDHHLLWRFDAQMFQEDFYISVDFVGGHCYIIIACLTVHLGAFCLGLMLFCLHVAQAKEEACRPFFIVLDIGESTIDDSEIVSFLNVE